MQQAAPGGAIKAPSPAGGRAHAASPRAPAAKAAAAATQTGFEMETVKPPRTAMSSKPTLPLWPMLLVLALIAMGFARRPVW